MVGRSLCTPADGFNSRAGRRELLGVALYIRDCESLCLSDETLKAVGVYARGSIWCLSDLPSLSQEMRILVVFKQNVCLYRRISLNVG